MNLRFPVRGGLGARKGATAPTARCERVEQAAAHAQEPNVQRQAELMVIAAARLDQRALGRAEGGKRPAAQNR